MRKARAARDKESPRTIFFITISFLERSLFRWMPPRTADNHLSKWSQQRRCLSEAQASLGLSEGQRIEDGAAGLLRTGRGWGGPSRLPLVSTLINAACAPAIVGARGVIAARIVIVTAEVVAVRRAGALAIAPIRPAARAGRAPSGDADAGGVPRLAPRTVAVRG